MNNNCPSHTKYIHNHYTILNSEPQTSAHFLLCLFFSISCSPMKATHLFLSLYNFHFKCSSFWVHSHILCYITCKKILVLWLVESRLLFQLFIASGDRTSYCTAFRSANVQKWFTIALRIHIFIRVFSISNTNFRRLL